VLPNYQKGLDFMTSILEELYNGNASFSGGDYNKDSPFVMAAQRKLDSMAALKETLNDSQMELLNGYIEAQGEIEHITRYDTYVATLKFGILLMFEIFAKGGAVYEQ
jgi:hypothetical protein